MMVTPGPFETAVFLLFAAVAIAGAVGLIMAKRVAHSLLYLIFSFLAVAGIFVLQEAEFLAIVQVLAYLGSGLLVVLFGVMLTRRQIMEEV